MLLIGTNTKTILHRSILVGLGHFLSSVMCPVSNVTQDPGHTIGSLAAPANKAPQF